MADTTEGTATTEGEDKPKGSKADQALNLILDHVTSHGTDADDTLRSKVHELTGGKVGSPARGTVSEEDDA